MKRYFLSTMAMVGGLLGCHRAADQPVGQTAPEMVRQVPVAPFNRPGLRESPVVVAQRNASRVPGLMEDLNSKDSAKRRQAVQALARMGEEAKPAADLALQLARDDKEPQELRLEAALVLGRVRRGDQVIAILREALGNPKDVIRMKGALALAEVGPSAKAALPDLMKSFQDPNPLVRALAARALGGLGNEAKQALPALAETLKDATNHPLVRAQATRALAKMGPAGEAGVPILLGALKDHKYHRFDPAEAAKFELDSLVWAALYSTSADRIEEALKPTGYTLPVAFRIDSLASHALKDLGAIALPGLVAQINDPDDRCRYLAVSALGNMGGPANKPEIIRKLQMLLNDESLEVRRVAGEGLKKLNPEVAAKEGLLAKPVEN